MASRREYLDRFKRVREKRILGRAGKALLFNEDRMIEAISENIVPTCMQHCVIVVKPKMDKEGGTEKESYISAFNICAAVFKKHGYMHRTQNSLKLTGKGMKNNRRHQRERQAGVKRGRFLVLTNRLWKRSIAMFRDDKKRSKRIRKLFPEIDS